MGTIMKINDIHFHFSATSVSTLKQTHLTNIYFVELFNPIIAL